MGELYPNVGAQAAIRALVDQHVQRMDKQQIAEVERLASEIDLEEMG